MLASLFLVSLVLLGACAALDPVGAARDDAARAAARAGLAARVLPAGRFRLLTYRRVPAAPARDLVAYIEGDGHAWDSPSRPSRDPTPRDPGALDLAVRDPAPAVAYIARPCQYVTGADRTGCHPRYWTGARFAPEVLDAVQEALDRTMRAAGASRLHLVGFSGGGVLATLAAARRTDVASLVTVASPLNLGAWVAHHRLTPLAGSLDPAAPGQPRPAAPQAHLVGARDTVVPPAVARAYLGAGSPALRLIAGADHRCCWVPGWARRITDLRRELAGGG
ncbi:MAG: alpha/beta hydrolase [Hyphomicrobiales bacterium]|nr:alpha/beta hydrolase [Hyphomicrobiales bacterium]